MAKKKKRRHHELLKTRRHHNNKGLRQIKEGKTIKQIEDMAKRLFKDVNKQGKEDSRG